MNFSEEFNVWKERAVDVAQAAAAKSKQVAAVVKAKVNIAAEEDKIRKAQIELGKLYYRDFAAGSEQDAAEYLPWCEKITEAKQSIAEQLEIIESMKQTCEACDGEDEEFTVEVAEDAAEKTEEAAPAEAPEAPQAEKTEE
ncbi:MAG: serine proteinase [Oscillospiraceae bacterium]|nr:serine proteinase [Oscillospiraceae bacterium]